MRYVFTFDEKSWVRMHYAAMRQSGKIPSFARYLRYLKICMLKSLFRFIFIIFNLQISTISQTSSPLIYRPFTQPSLTRNLKADSQQSPGTLLSTKMEIADTNFWFKVSKDPILSRNTQIRKKSTMKMK